MNRAFLHLKFESRAFHESELRMRSAEVLVYKGSLE